MKKPLTHLITNLFVSLAFVSSSALAADTLRYDQNSKYTGNWQVNAKSYMKIDNATVNFGGTLISTSGSSAANFWLNNGKVIIDADARIYNNMPDQINARTVYAVGKSYTRDTIVLDEGFVADYTGFLPGIAPKDQPNWTNLGFSVLWMNNVSVVTRHTQSFPTIHKKQPNGDYTHHGVFYFMPGDTCSWTIEKNDQETDAQLIWAAPLHVYSYKNFTFNGKFHYPHVGVVFGSGKTINTSSNGEKLIKHGPANIIIKGDQEYAPETMIDVREGGFIFKSNPANEAQGPYPILDAGQNLQLAIGKKGFVNFDTTGAGLQSLNSNGTLELKKSKLHVKENMTLQPSSYLNIANPTDSLPIRVEGNATLNGTLKVDPALLTRDTTVILSSPNAISGTFAKNESGMQVIYNRNEVKLVKTNTAINTGLTAQKPFVYYIQGAPYLRIPTGFAARKLSIVSASGVSLAQQNLSDQTNDIDLKAWGVSEKQLYLLLIEGVQGKHLIKIANL